MLLFFSFWDTLVASNSCTVNPVWGTVFIMRELNVEFKKNTSLYNELPDFWSRWFLLTPHVVDHPMTGSKDRKRANQLHQSWKPILSYLEDLSNVTHNKHLQDIHPKNVFKLLVLWRLRKISLQTAFANLCKWIGMIFFFTRTTSIKRARIFRRTLYVYIYICIYVHMYI